MVVAQETPTGAEEAALSEAQGASSRVRQAAGPETEGSQGEEARGDQASSLCIHEGLQVIRRQRPQQIGSLNLFY